MPTLASDLVPEAMGVPAETDPDKPKDTLESLDVVGDVKQPAFGDYATLLELIDASYKQKSVRIPMKVTSTQSGEIKREEMFPCPSCAWISRSKAEAKRHAICFHSHEPLQEIHKKMIAMAAETGPTAEDVASSLKEAKTALKGTLDSVQPLSAGSTTVKKRPAAELKPNLKAAGKPKIPKKDTIDDEVDHAVAKVLKRSLGPDGEKLCKVSYVDKSLSTAIVPEASLGVEWIQKFSPPEATEAGF